MNRRTFLCGLTLGTLCAPLGVGAQPTGKLRQIGYLDQGSADRNRPYLDGLRRGLRELGWLEGQNIAIEARFAEGKTDHLATLATELMITA
jgi:putative tryptophan/tyrosine transport system substrate-binding protein